MKLYLTTQYNAAAVYFFWLMSTGRKSQETEYNMKWEVYKRCFILLIKAQELSLTLLPCAIVSSFPFSFFYFTSFYLIYDLYFFFYLARYRTFNKSEPPSFWEIFAICHTCFVIKPVLKWSHWNSRLYCNKKYQKD